MVTTQKQDGRDVVTIKSADPSVLYVPSYDPVAVYNPLPDYGIAAGLLTFGAAVAIGSAWRGNYWNWGTGAFYPPIWPGYPAWRPPYAGWRPGMPIGGGGNINIGDRPWRPDGGHYRPGGRPPASAVGSAAVPVLEAALVADQVLAVALAVQSARPRPAARPSARPVTRPATRPAKRPATNTTSTSTQTYETACAPPIWGQLAPWRPSQLSAGRLRRLPRRQRGL